MNAESPSDSAFCLTESLIHIPADSPGRTPSSRSRGRATSALLTVGARLRKLYERPFFGREGLISAVRTGIADPGENLVLVGPGGVGKTSLAIAALRGLPANIRIVHITATESTRNTPLGAFDAVLGDTDRAQLGDTTDAVGRAIIAACLDTAAPGYGAANAKAAQLVLHVDDTPDLDAMSAAVIDYLISRTDVRVVMTCRSNPGLSSALVRSVRDNVVTRIDVPDLTPAESASFIASCLPDKPIAPDSLARMHEITGGNALFLSELLRSVDAAHGLKERMGLWVWESPLPAGTSLDDLLRSEIEHLTGAQREAFEVIALTAPIAIELIAGLTDLSAVGELADMGWITVSAPGREGSVVSLTQPLYGEAMTALVSLTRAGGIHASLYASTSARLALDVTPDGAYTGDPTELLIAVEWGLRSGADIPLWMLRAAFGFGRSLAEYDYRIRITTALLRHPDAPANLRAQALTNRAEAHRFTGNPAAASEDTTRGRAVIDALPDDAERVRLAVDLAVVSSDALVLQEGRWEDALDILDWGASHVAEDDRDSHIRLDASRGIYLAYGGQMSAMLDLARRVQRESRGSSRFLPLASTLILALGQQGESKQARALARTQMAFAATAMGEHPLAAGEIVGAWCLADMFLGHPREASFIYGLMNTAAARNPGHVQLRKTLVAFGRGLLAVVDADWPAAVEHLSIAGSELDDFTGTGSEGLLMASLALAHAAVGDYAASDAARAKLETWPNGTSQLLDAPTQYFLLLARLHAPRGDEADQARALIARARSYGFALMELRALHALALATRTLTAEELARAGELASEIDAPIATPLHASLRAIVEGDTVAASEAARLLARRGLLIPSPQHSALTPREHQLAELISLGYSNTQIAKKMHLSKRTIETHAAHIFQKLHINSREDVGDALARDE